jgi:hypothetical protein
MVNSGDSALGRLAGGSTTSASFWSIPMETLPASDLQSALQIGGGVVAAVAASATGARGGGVACAGGGGGGGAAAGGSDSITGGWRRGNRWCRLSGGSPLRRRRIGVR